MLRICAITAALMAALAGCAVGIDETQSPTANFQVDKDYVAAFSAADTQARKCLRGENAYTVTDKLDRDARSGLLRVTAPFIGREVARVQVQSLDAKRTDVHIAMWGRGAWDKIAVDAMRDAIIYGVPSCVSFMPGAPAPHR